MEYKEIFDMIAGVEGKNADVWVTSKVSGKRYKMNLHITSLNILKMRHIGVRGIGYNVSQMHADKWEKVEFCGRKKKK